MIHMVDGKEIKVGSRLWHIAKEDWWICHNSSALVGRFLTHPGTDGLGRYNPSTVFLTWEKPQVIKYANLYYNTKVDGEKVLTSSKLYDTEAEADANAITSRRIERVAVTVGN